MTERIYSTDSYARAMDAVIVGTDTEQGRVLLDRTVFYPGGGGQPHDTGILRTGDDRLVVTRITQEGDGIWHWLEGGMPGEGTSVRGEVDWDRRYTLMRTHTAMHALCGVIWNRFQSPVTGGNMEPGEGRLDFDLPGWDPDDRSAIEDEVNLQMARALPIEISFLPREEADRDPSLIRTKANLLPPTITTLRIVDIVGLDRQADGGTHVADTTEVGGMSITKVESKGKGFRRIRIALGPQPHGSDS